MLYCCRKKGQTTPDEDKIVNRKIKINQNYGRAKTFIMKVKGKRSFIGTYHGQRL